jgi:hypothetical protein
MFPPLFISVITDESSLTGLENPVSVTCNSNHPVTAAPPAQETSDLYHFTKSKGMSRKSSKSINISRSETFYSYSVGRLGITVVCTRRSHTRSKGRNIENQDIFRVRDYVLELSSTILGYYMRLSFRYVCGSISHSLHIDPVADIDDPIFYLCLDREVSAVRSMLDQQLVSPFVRDHSGATLLHVSFFPPSVRKALNVDSMLLLVEARI